jgi:predicted TPR repeat methyltransferase
LDTLYVSATLDALRERATQLIDAGRTNVARPLLAAARALACPSADLDLLEARLAVAEGAWDRAILTLDKSLDSIPSHAGLRKCRAFVRHRMGDREGAAMDAAEAVVLDPGDPHAKAILGRVMLDLGHTVEAIACLAEAVGIAPKNPDYRESLATALEKSGDADAALEVLIDGIALGPVGVSLRNAAIILCVRRRDFVQAVRLAEKARSVGVADACTLGMKGHALSSLGRDEEAAVAYREALNLRPEDPYIRHLVVSSGELPATRRAPAGFIAQVFDGYADRFESHLIELGYALPAAIRSLLLLTPTIAAGLALGPVLDLGCGTGMVGVALQGLPVGPITGVDLSERMLCHARAKRLYTELRHGDIVDELATHRQSWPLIVAADVLCYFGALDEVLELVHKRLARGGLLIFSTEVIRPDHDGTLPGNGRWALQRQGRYAHSEDYVNQTVRAVGLRVVQIDRLTIRREAGASVPGLLLAVERKSFDD